MDIDFPDASPYMWEYRVNWKVFWPVMMRETFSKSTALNASINKQDRQAQKKTNNRLTDMT